MINVNYIRQMYHDSLAEFENRNKELMESIQKSIIDTAKSARNSCRLDFKDTDISKEDIYLISQILKYHGYQVFGDANERLFDVSW